MQNDLSLKGLKLTLQCLTACFQIRKGYPAGIQGLKNGSPADAPAGTCHYQPLHEIFQLPDISRPVVFHQQPDTLLRNSNGLTVFLLEDLAKFLDQQGDILFPLPQGTQINGHHIQTVVEVLPEAAVPDLLPQVFIGGGNDPQVQLDRLCTAQADQLPLLNDTEQLYPVNAPDSYPNSSDSSNSSGIAAQFTLIKGRPFRVLR